MDGSTVVLESLAVNGLVVCTGTFMLSVDDVDNLERESGARVAAVDKYGYSVGAAATTLVVLSQVVTRNVDCTIVNRRHQRNFCPSKGTRQTILGQVELISMLGVPCFEFVQNVGDEPDGALPGVSIIARTSKHIALSGQHH